MTLERGKDEVVNLKNRHFSLKTATTKDGRQFVDINACIMNFFNVEDYEVKTYLKDIPQSYFKYLTINDEKIRFMDRLALGIVLNYNHNFELFKWVIDRNVSEVSNYGIELFCNVSEKILSDIGDMEKISKSISKYDDLQQDMLHDAEKNHKTSEEKIMFYDELEELRKSRRQYKNQLAFLKHMKNYFDEHNISEKNLEELLRSVSKLHYIFEKKVYNQRATSVAHQEIKEVMAKKIASKKNLKQETEKQKMAKLNKMMRKAGIR